MVTFLNLADKFSQFDQHWHPYIVGELNGQYIKVVKAKGELVWHSHQHEDELFQVLSGRLIMDFRDRTVEVGPGEILIVPRGVEHRPRTGEEEVRMLLFEPKATRHTGELVVAETVDEQTWL